MRYLTNVSYYPVKGWTGTGKSINLKGKKKEYFFLKKTNHTTLSRVSQSIGVDSMKSFFAQKNKQKIFSLYSVNKPKSSVYFHHNKGIVK